VDDADLKTLLAARNGLQIAIASFDVMPPRPSDDFRTLDWYRERLRQVEEKISQLDLTAD